MKKIILRNGLFFLMGVSVITSCGQNKENTESNTTEETITKTDKTIKKISYRLNLSETYFDFFEIVAEYTDKDGSTVSKTLTDNLDLSLETDGKFCEANIKVIAKPKNNIPEIDKEKIYDFKKSYYINIETIPNGSKDMGDSATLPVKGSKLNEFASKEHVLVSQSYNCMQ